MKLIEGAVPKKCEPATGLERLGRALPSIGALAPIADRSEQLDKAWSRSFQSVLRWGEQVGARVSKPRRVQRGARYAVMITDFRKSGRLIATLCEVDRLGHAWSGGAAGHPYSDPKGPDASRMIWSFIARQFANAAD